MIKTAEVLSLDGKYATVKAKRSSMCDGCHKSECEGGCAMSSLLGTEKYVTATALNKAGAEVGDTVELESSDKTVLLYAFAVFILPIVFAIVFYAVGAAAFGGDKIPAVFAVIGFCLCYAGVGIYGRLKKEKEADIVILRIVKKHEIGDENEE